MKPKHFNKLIIALSIHIVSVKICVGVLMAQRVKIQ